jgi:hypothetical protein
MAAAWRRVKANRGSAGADGRSIEDTAAYLRAHWPGIREAILNGSYRPTPVKRVQIPKPSGGRRLTSPKPVVRTRIFTPLGSRPGPRKARTILPMPKGLWLRRNGRSAEEGEQSSCVVHSSQ